MWFETAIGAMKSSVTVLGLAPLTGVMLTNRGFADCRAPSNVTMSDKYVFHVELFGLLPPTV
jgi:hypothetical protein